MRRQKGLLNYQTIALALVCSALFFQNCGGFRAIGSAVMSQTIQQSSGIPGAAAVLQPATDKKDSACLTNSKYDACLFLKNPVASQNASFNSIISTSASLDGLQTFGVKLTGLKGGGALRNDTFSVETVRGTAVNVGTTNLRTLARGDKAQTIAQVMTYYWLNRTSEYIQDRTGTLPAKDRQTRVVVDDTLAGWSPETNSIHLKLPDSGDSMAWSADLAIHFFGVANLFHATSGAIRNSPDLRHRTCGLKTYGCCKDSGGCSRAIASGVGDYFVAMMFPTQPTVGETWSNRIEGLGLCNVTRDVRLAATRTPSAAYAACAASGVDGETSTMGTVYASLWWEMRKAAGGAQGEADIDTLFMKHLALLDGEDNFGSAFTKVLTLEMSLYKGKYKGVIESQMRARNLL